MTLLTRVLTIVVLALLPAVAAELYSEHARRMEQVADFRDDALREARSVSNNVQRIITGVRSAMIAVAALPSVRNSDGVTCNPLLASLQPRLAFAGVLALVGSDGHRVCASNGNIPLTDDLSERPPVRLARERRGFVTAGYLVGKASRKPELAVGLALDPGAGSRSPVLVADIDLPWLWQQIAALQEPGGTVVTLADRDGISLLDGPGTAVGGRVRPEIAALMRARSAGVTEMLDANGLPATVGYVPASLSSQGLFVAVGFSNVPADARRQAAFRRGLALLAGGFAVGLTGAVLLARFAVGRPVAAILTTIDSWRGGNASARVASREVASSPDFAAIASALNDLLQAFERTRAELLEREDTLTRRVAERTAQLEAEVRDREEAQASLQQAQKMEVIGQLTGGVAHDFNNLLTAIVGNLELARRRGAGDAGLSRLLTNAMRAADRGAALTQRMLAFGRRQYLALQTISAEELISDMEDLLARTLDANVQVRLELPAGLWPMVGDRNQVELVILNLAINARDAMPGGGVLVIAAHNFAFAAGAPPHPAHLAPGDYVELALSDTGNGMDAATVARVTEPFFTTKPVGKGSGLGLSMAQGVAAQSGGGLAIESVLGRGTTVRIWLPRAEAEPTRAVADETPREPVATSSNTVTGAVILLVEDDPEVAEFAQQCLVDEGFKVIRTENGQAAVAVAESAGRIDLILADLAMPGMNGLQLAARLRRSRPQLPVLIATGYADAETFDGGHAGYPVLEKPFKSAQLLAAVRALLGEAIG